MSHDSIGYIEQEEGEESAPLMILEYMQYGDLHGFLVKNRYATICQINFVRLIKLTFDLQTRTEQTVFYKENALLYIFI